MGVRSNQYQNFAVIHLTGQHFCAIFFSPRNRASRFAPFLLCIVVVVGDIHEHDRRHELRTALRKIPLLFRPVGTFFTVFSVVAQSWAKSKLLLDRVHGSVFCSRSCSSPFHLRRPWPRPKFRFFAFTPLGSSVAVAQTRAPHRFRFCQFAQIKNTTAARRNRPYFQRHTLLSRDVVKVPF